MFYGQNNRLIVSSFKGGVAKIFRRSGPVEYQRAEKCGLKGRSIENIFILYRYDSFKSLNSVP